jgi:hypothetical protein
MFKKLLALFGKKKPAPLAAPYLPSLPYKQDELNLIYNLLFCDESELYQPHGTETTLFGEQADARVVRTIAEDKEEESRVRILAYSWLRDNGHAVPSKELLGVIVEVPLEEGLDVLAAYADGTVRYINQTGKFAVFEGSPDVVTDSARTLVETSKPALRQATPIAGKRMPPPGIGHIRLGFLASDGLHFTQGTFETLARDAKASAAIQSAQTLLDLVVRQASE